jgi:hypothetical protein
LVESTTVQQLWAGVTTKKLILDIFSISPNCQPRVSRSSRHAQVMLQTVTLFYIHCGCALLLLIGCIYAFQKVFCEAKLSLFFIFLMWFFPSIQVQRCLKNIHGRGARHFTRGGRAGGAHHAEGLINPKVRVKKRLLILDTTEHVDSENIKLKIGPRRGRGPCSTNFF